MPNSNSSGPRQAGRAHQRGERIEEGPDVEGRRGTAALIQWSLSAEETAGPEAFAGAVERRAARACGGGETHLLVFPELSGLWLLLAAVSGRSPVAGREERISSAARETVRLLGRFLGRPRTLARMTARGVAGLQDEAGWRAHLGQWLEPFQEAACRHGLYICPGSTLLPPFRREPAGRMRIVGRRLMNTSCLIAPNGRVLGFRRKLRRTPLERRAGIGSGTPERDLLPFDTELGRLGIALCLDGFYPDIVDAFDAQGCRLLLQPSANSIDWNARLERGGKNNETERVVLQREEWLGCGAGALIQGAENLRVVYNPMCVTGGRLLRHSGKSSVWVNRRLAAEGAASQRPATAGRLQQTEPAGRPQRAGPASRGEPEEAGEDRVRGLIAIAADEYREEVMYGPIP